MLHRYLGGSGWPAMLQKHANPLVQTSTAFRDTSNLRIPRRFAQKFLLGLRGKAVPDGPCMQRRAVPTH